MRILHGLSFGSISTSIFSKLLKRTSSGSAKHCAHIAARVASPGAVDRADRVRFGSLSARELLA